MKPTEEKKMLDSIEFCLKQGALQVETSKMILDWLHGIEKRLTIVRQLHLKPEKQLRAAIANLNEIDREAESERGPLLQRIRADLARHETQQEKIEADLQILRKTL